MNAPAIRAGSTDDAGTLLRMFDDAVAWQVRRGGGGQWGTEPWSADPAKVERVREMADRPGLWIAEFDGEPAGALLVTEWCPDHIPPPAEPELYVNLLLTAGGHGGKGVGGTLLDHAREVARARGLGLLRVDCWAGGDGSLVRYYTGQGFTPTERFDYRGWPGQLLEQRVR
ncbi:GNAT family N-acetyltransferase [Amycolatopsis cihanbeyliensis]|uniref:Acetyltransferase (GNAT) family protein n=1 Tax=Amycolatopsis cihanbeyliensis TaxID=1128664 RepID=A0A542DHE9_AMYCI|nr:GNAT family N-acetyltransferase [Amycolatopsis cihanbeyliensis]TQJ02491.1 acetyltransferase (GNAT) family protein [Amycolatopsis cihanbeyliensis]